MRFLFVSLGYHPDQIGGAWRYTTEVAECLVKRGHVVEVIYPSTQGHPVGEETRAGVFLKRYPDARGGAFQNWRSENSIVKQGVADLVARGKPAPTLIVLSHAFLWPSVFDFRAHTAFMFHGPWGREFLHQKAVPRKGLATRMVHRVMAAAMNRVERSALERSRNIVTTSRWLTGEIQKWYGGRLAPIFPIGGGVNCELFKPAENRAATRLKFGVKPEEFLFLTVRRLDPRMGLHHLLEAFAPIAREFPMARLWLAGRGPQEAHLKDQIQGFGLTEQVKLLGFVRDEDLPDLFSAADCTLMPSVDLEGFGLATVESLACGTPVIGSAVCATPEVLGPLDSKLLYDPDRPGALGERLRSVLKEPGSLPGREACRNYAVREFGWEKPAAGLEACAARLFPKA